MAVQVACFGLLTVTKPKDVHFSVTGRIKAANPHKRQAGTSLNILSILVFKPKAGYPFFLNQ